GGDVCHGALLFRAEDGIRDDLVTGVQTCALPISQPSGGERAQPIAGAGAVQLDAELLRRAMAYATVLASFNVEEFGTERVRRLRSEERRVGKEWRSHVSWGPQQGQYKKRRRARQE